jgi:hypothetical protein
MLRPCLPVNKPHGISDNRIQSRIELISRRPKSENGRDGYSRPIAEVPFIIALNVFEVVGDHIHQHEFDAFPAPYLPKMRWVFSLRFCDAINRMVDRNACQKSGGPNWGCCENHPKRDQR